MLQNLLTHGNEQYFIACTSVEFLVADSNIPRGEIEENTIDILDLAKNVS